VDACTIDAYRDRGVERGDNRVGPAALEGSPATQWPTEPVIKSAFAFAGWVNDERVDLEECGNTQHASLNHPGTSEIIVALDDDVGL